MTTFIKNFFKENPFIKNARRMWPFLKPYWFRGLLGIVLTLPVAGFDAVIMSFLKPVMDNVMVAKQPEFSAMLPYLIIGFAFLQGVFNYSSNYVTTWFGNKVTMGVKRKLFDKLLSLDSAYFDKNSSGAIVLRYSNDAETASAALVSNFKLFVQRLVSSVCLAGVMIWFAWELSIMALGVLVFIVYPVKIVREKIKSITKKSVGAGSKIITLYNEVTAGNKIVHSFTLESAMRKRFHETTDQIFTLAIKMVQGSGWLSPVMHFITAIGLALVVAFSTRLIINGNITSGDFAAFLGSLIALYTPLKSIGNNYVEIQKSFLAIDRIFNIFSLQPTVKDVPGAKKLSGVKKGITFKDVHFRYKADKPVLQGININIPVGQTIALVGNSGGGKTTIAALIPRLYDIQKGEITIDGVGIKNFSKHSLRQQISMVFQDNFLFSGTIKENIILANPSLSDENIWAALKNACLDDFVRGLPQKLDTQIGERGMLLSGGQKQRLAIARAFVKNAPVVILDEATSALDNKSEKVVQTALENLMKNRTVIVIAHRLSTVQNADNIIVVNDGLIAEQGTHKELLKLQGAYNALYQSQFKKQEE